MVSSVGPAVTLRIQSSEANSSDAGIWDAGTKLGAIVVAVRSRDCALKSEKPNKRPKPDPRPALRSISRLKRRSSSACAAATALVMTR